MTEIQVKMTKVNKNDHLKIDIVCISSVFYRNMWFKNRQYVKPFRDGDCCEMSI